MKDGRNGPGPCNVRSCLVSSLKGYRNHVESGRGLCFSLKVKGVKHEQARS
jgi:hypothetical protein